MQLLQRGFEVTAGNRIQRPISEGTGWQIYSTNSGLFVLAVQAVIYGKWINEYQMPQNLFSKEPCSGCFIISSSGDYIISSLSQGPFPSNIGQIDAFSVAFKAALSKYPDADYSEAVYLEEYSLVLPTTFDRPYKENDVVFGKWITGGIEISVLSMDRISKIMTWLPKERLTRSAEMAGFQVKFCEKNNSNLQQDQTKEKVIKENRVHSLPLPKERFSLPGRTELEKFFNDNIVDVVLHQEQYARMGISFPGATVLYGPPGCGKTFAVEKLAEYLGWPKFIIDSGTIGSSFIHETSKKISGIFHAAMDAAPSIIIIDEMEAFLSDRASSGNTGNHHTEEVAEFLRRIPEATAKGVLVFAMTNLIDSIDSAILRRGRFDYIIEVKMASAEEIEQLLQTKLAVLPINDSINISAIAKQLAEHPLSDVAFVLREAGKVAVKKGLEKMNQECFDEALNLLPKKKEYRRIGF